MPFIERQEGPVDSGIEETKKEDKEEEEKNDNNYELDDEVTDDVVKTPEQIAREERQRFNEWAEKYEPHTLRDCGASIFEEGNLVGDGFRYQTVMVNTCINSTKKYTIFMDVMDWFKVESFYTTVDTATKSVVQDSVIRECHMYE